MTCPWSAEAHECLELMGDASPKKRRLREFTSEASVDSLKVDDDSDDADDSDDDSDAEDLGDFDITLDTEDDYDDDDDIQGLTVGAMDDDDDVGDTDLLAAAEETALVPLNPARGHAGRVIAAAAPTRNKDVTSVTRLFM